VHSRQCLLALRPKPAEKLLTSSEHAALKFCLRECVEGTQSLAQSQAQSISRQKYSYYKTTQTTKESTSELQVIMKKPKTN
jgi:hypothetical protein